MGETSNELKGPDLTQPRKISEMQPGQMITGHAFGEPVLLVRVSDDFFAIGAHCTHYSASLEEGVIIDETIRCPWHHACFSLRNGAATCAPALNDLPVYAVAVENNTVRVTEKIDPASLHSNLNRPRMSRAPAQVRLDPETTAGPASVLIAGGGAAGDACAEMLRREGYRGKITIVDPDGDAPYDRPNLSKDFLAGSAPPEWLALHPPDFYQQQQIELLRGIEVTGADTNTNIATFSDGTARPYGALLIATGASPVRLEIPGAEHIDYLRSLNECRNLVSKAEKSKRAVVIGASFIGLEVAASLCTRGLDVTVVGPEEVPLARVLGEQLGRLIRKVHEDKGVKFMLGRKPRSVTATDVTLDDGSRLEADMVVAGVGVRPNVSLAEKAGIALNDGIIVNEFLETSAPRVFAAGDAARWPDSFTGEPLRVEHWVVAQRMGQVAARNMLGYRDRFDVIPFFWSNHFESLSIHYSGHATKWDETRVEGDPAKLDCMVDFIKGNRRIAAATINRDIPNLKVELEMEKELLTAAPPPVAQELSN